MASRTLPAPSTTGKPFSVCPTCQTQFRRGGNIPPKYCSVKCRATGESVPELMNKETLQALYAEHNAEQIGAMFGRSRKVVEKWLKRHGIPQKDGGRGRSPNCRRIKKGDPNPMSGRHHSVETRRLMSEAAKASGRIPYKVENGPPWKGITGPQHPSWKGGVTPERAAFYASDEWKAASYLVWKRDGRTCQRCGLKKQRCDGVSFDIHHIVPFTFAPLRAEPTNLILFCEPCHYWVHSKGNIERLWIKDAPAASPHVAEEVESC